MRTCNQLTGRSTRRAQRPGSLRRLVALGSIGILLGFMPARSAVAANNDVMTKSKFLFSLALHTEWPAGSFTSKDDPFRLCTLNAEEVAAALNFISIGKSIHGHPVEVVELLDAAHVDDCQLAFASDTQKTKLRKLSVQAHGKGVLTVADTENFTDVAGCIGFDMIGDKVQFSINRTAIARNKLKVSDKLLSLGNIVH